jgi:hypothetical protein
MDSIANHLTTAYAGAYAPSIPTLSPHTFKTAQTRTKTKAKRIMPPQSQPQPQPETQSPQEDDRERRGSTPDAWHSTLYPVRTRSLGGYLSAGVISERDPSSPPSDDDIIIVTVRLSRKERRNSYDDPLPDRYVHFVVSRLKAHYSSTSAPQLPRGITSH